MCFVSVAKFEDRKYRQGLLRAYRPIIQTAASTGQTGYPRGAKFFSNRRSKASGAVRPEVPIGAILDHVAAVTVISMRAPAGNAATCTVVRPGGITLKYSA
jgi:hypothetical protein